MIYSPSAAYRALSSGTVPDFMEIEGVLDYSGKSQRQLPTTFPKKIKVDVLNLQDADLKDLPFELEAYEAIFTRTSLQRFSHPISVKSRLRLTQCELLEELPTNLQVGTLELQQCNSLKSLPEGLDVWFLDLTGCWALENWPKQASIHSGRLTLRGCTALKHLPDYLNLLSFLNVRDCPNLKQLPADIKISGWLDLAHSGLNDASLLPGSLQDTQLRWAGISVDRRIAFSPDQIQTSEILGEMNAERRRVLIDRYGYGRFLQDAEAEQLDEDCDPGGQRHLLRVKLNGDEDLVALSCFCPSTQRQYIIRVPPNIKTCHHAAAWIAGFDNPDDYHPLKET